MRCPFYISFNIKGFFMSISDSELNFRNMALSDIPMIRKMLESNPIRTCDRTLCGLYLWGLYYEYKMCVFDGTLYIKGRDENGEPAYAFPIGGDTAAAVRRILRHCRENGETARFSFVPQELLPMLPGGRAERLSGWSDYVYAADSLATLSGKKLHKKKNRFNKFVADHPQHELVPITAETLPEAVAFYKKYCDEGGFEDPRLYAERAAIERLLSEFGDLGIFGAVLRAEGRCVGFSLGDRVGDTLYIHFEKADKSVEGAYEALNCLFVRENAADCVYVDMEEDMDEPGIRQAKNAYNPAMLIDKYEVVFDTAN